MIINIRGFEFEPASSFESGEDWDANVSTNEIDGEMMVEIRTMGPVDEICLPEHVRTIRLSRNALRQLVSFAKMLDAQPN